MARVCWHTALSRAPGRVGPAPYTQHLLRPSAATAQNSSFGASQSSTIVGAQKSLQFERRRASEQLRDTSNYFLRVGAPELRATSQTSELLRATPYTPSGGRPRTPSHSEPIRATPIRATPTYSWPLRALPSTQSAA